MYLDTESSYHGWVLDTYQGKDGWVVDAHCALSQFTVKAKRRKAVIKEAERRIDLLNACFTVASLEHQSFNWKLMRATAIKCIEELRGNHEIS